MLSFALESLFSLPVTLGLLVLTQEPRGDHRHPPGPQGLQKANWTHGPTALGVEAHHRLELEGPS